MAHLVLLVVGGLRAVAVGAEARRVVGVQAAAPGVGASAARQLVLQGFRCKGLKLGYTAMYEHPRGVGLLAPYNASKGRTSSSCVQSIRLRVHGHSE
jgi:hypothetical protein